MDARRPNRESPSSPAFQSSQSDHLLEMADRIAHALVKREHEPSTKVVRLVTDRAYGMLKRALNRRGHGEPPRGVVRRSELAGLTLPIAQPRQRPRRQCEPHRPWNLVGALNLSLTLPRLDFQKT